MADGKWITDLAADVPLAEAARHVLAVRLRVVGEALPRAVFEADRDPEHVHQLRVATRRADAAVRIFAPCLPDRAYRTARRRLRRLRRAAGAARDWDVFLIALLARCEGQPAKEQPGLDFLIGYAAGQRRAAQAQLEEAGADQMSGFETFLAETVAAVRAPQEAGLQSATLLDLARPLLSRLLHDLEVKASGDLEDYAHLHQVRIAGKRLRYAMEVFALCFDASFREKLYPQVEEMQEILGRANDSHVAEGRLTALRDRLRRGAPGEWKRYQPAVAGLLRFHQRRLPQERRRFLKWWDGWRKSGAEALLALTPSAAAPARRADLRG
jgi:CHAD domain-containing protein